MALNNERYVFIANHLQRVKIMVKQKNVYKWIIALCTIVYFASYFSRKSFAASMVELFDKNVIEEKIAGIVELVLFVCYGAGQLVSGYLGDRIPPKYLIFSGLMVSSLCNLLLPIVNNQFLFIPIWAVNGFAQALLWPPIVRILSDNLTNERYVTANLIVTCGAHVATMILYLWVPLCIRLTSWKGAFISASILCVIIGVIFIVAMTMLFRKEQQIAEQEVQAEVIVTEEQTEKPSILKVFSSSGVLLVFIAIIMMGFMRDGIESWFPTLYSQAFNRTPEEATAVSSLLPLFTMASIFVVRFLHKTKLFNNEVLGSGITFLLSMVLCVPLAILISVKGTVSSTICLVLVCVICALMHACNFLLISCLPGRFVGTGRTATIGGCCNACVYIGAAAASYGIPAVSSILGWSGTAISWIAICVIGLIFAILALKKYSKFLQKDKE